jgi:DNA processing protein
MLTHPSELLEIMGWDDQKIAPRKQRELFPQLTADEEKIINLLTGIESLHIDEINNRSGLSSSGVAAAILGLELNGMALSLPGKHYKLV